jgi:hypothetical protein
VALPSIGDLWGLVRRVDTLFTTVAKHTEAMEKLATRVEELERELIRVKAERDQMITEARTAATAASSAVIGTLAKDVGALQERTRHMDRLPPPGAE